LAIQVALHHATRYTYDRPISLGPHVVRLRPAPHCRTPIRAYSLRIKPEPHFLNWQQDPFGNYQARIVFPELATELGVEVDLVAEMTTINPFDFFLEEEAEHYPFAYAAALRRDLAPYLEKGPGGKLLTDFARVVAAEDARSGRRIIDVLVDINRRVMRSLRYDIRMEPGVFSPEQTLERKHGSCRDFAWLLVQTLRQLGLAARFVSGYSIQLKADEKPVDGPSGVEHDATDLHAWAEVFLPGAGWVGLDATSGLLTGEGHIPLACTPDPETAAAVTGSYSWHQRDDDDKVGESFTFDMSVQRIAETPRVTFPYTDPAWRKIVALGQAVDRELDAGDVRLTMGGEPTFVAADDPEGDEWNTAALGPTKRRYATALLHRLYDRFKPGGLLHEGQGKWYPGEPLPRWALSCYFRKDGAPIWRNPSLFQREQRGSATEREALTFTMALANALGIDPDRAVPGHEDAWYYLWRERRLPTNVDPFDSRLKDEQERTRLARVFEQGLDRVVGYALPLWPTRGGDGTRWQSGRWFFRPERMYLIPGDSPMGYRLPLDSLPWVAAEEYPHVYPRDPFDPRAALPGRAAFDPRYPADLAGRRGFREGAPGRPELTPGEPRFFPRGAGAGSGPGDEADRRRDAAEREAARAIGRFESAPDIVRTALCVEPRDGILHIFLPPIAELEDFLALSAAIEDAAQEVGQKVRLEGYHPPNDPRLGRFQVTPDPGVIEVNIQPATDWNELVDITTGVYEDARQVGLRSEKFMVDGRHVGSGGGNHVVVGAATSNDSPFLRRPDLLRSMVGYWINHPALSYLFSGLFVGPTSQSPRVDEARHDSLYELEIAFRQLDAGLAQGGDVPPWLVDRLFRNLLVDITGNTHRTEFCIDKLYNPDSASGRLGLVELRSFEMPPHSRMSLVQQLLVRSLISSFWKEPYREGAVRWGTELFDRFSLPHFVRVDFEDVLEDLAKRGYPFETSWFAPHHEFRFPLLGTLEARGGTVLELRQAIEPWNVLGEENTGGGTARFVDSSVERVEVKLRGAVPDRHIVACNGRRVPLRPTGTNGEFVAGVRYRAWRPPSALHPLIDVQSPLVFDLFDRWGQRAIAGCTYHVAHPGGRSYDDFPRNGLAAESRRASRFLPFGHTPALHSVPEEETNPRFPFTLDLRR
jgi:uncharacterized protein (DUF2126 family)/transglutaminase-like putative cysteine protease